MARKVLWALGSVLLCLLNKPLGTADLQKGQYSQLSWKPATVDLLPKPSGWLKGPPTKTS